MTFLPVDMSSNLAVVEETCASPKKQKSEFSQVDNIRHSSVQETLIMYVR